MEVVLSREVVELIARGLPVYAMAPCCLVNVTWAEAVRPLIKMALTENIESMVCVQRLIVESNLGSCLNATLLAGGACAALSSAAPGDGQIHVYPSGTALDATTSRRPQDVNSALYLSSNATDDSGKRVIGFVEAPTSASSSTAREMVGLTVGEELGHGAEVNVWSIGESKKQAKHCVFLEHSSALSGPQQRAVVNGELGDDIAEGANFKCRATHLSTPDSSARLVLRTLVHNSFEASHERALIAAWDCTTGLYDPQASVSLCWENEPSATEDDVENLPPFLLAAATREGNDAPAAASKCISANSAGQGRYGGVDCAILYAGDSSTSRSVLATGHARSADGGVRVRLWDSETGQPANGTLQSSTYEACTLPTEGISVAGALSVSVSEDWVVASCADGRVYVWDRKTTHKMAVLASQGVLASAPAIDEEVDGSSGPTGRVSGSGPAVMAGLSPSEEPPAPPSRAAAETCTAVALQGGYLVCAFALTLGRSKASFKSRRKKEVRMAVFKLQRSVHNLQHQAQRRSPLALSPIKKTAAASPRVASFCGLLPELAVFEKPKMEEEEEGSIHNGMAGLTRTGDDAPNTEIAPPALAAASSQASSVAEWSVLGGEVRVNKLLMDLERRGKILVACGANGSNQNGEPIEGFLAEYDFLHTNHQVTA